ncbi:hypothetical protein D3C81_1178540 [compost metagenome]
MWLIGLYWQLGSSALGALRLLGTDEGNLDRLLCVRLRLAWSGRCGNRRFRHHRHWVMNLRCYQRLQLVDIPGW